MFGLRGWAGLGGVYTGADGALVWMGLRVIVEVEKVDVYCAAGSAVPDPANA